MTLGLGPIVFSLLPSTSFFYLFFVSLFRSFLLRFVALAFFMKAGTGV